MNLLNRLHAAGGYALRVPNTPKGPYRMVVEISNSCNLKCGFCLRTTDMKRPVHFMEPSFFEKLLQQEGHRLEHVGLNGFGEPLLHPRLAEFVEIAHRHGVGVSISTNCTLLTEERARPILMAGIDHVTLAIDGIRAEQYEAVRIGARFDRVIENARRFLELRREIGKKTFAIIQCIAMVQNKEDLRRIHAFWQGSGADAIRIRQLTHTGNECGDDQFDNGRGPCYWLWAEPMLLADGRLVACCQDVNGELPLGHAGDVPLDALWSGSEARRLRTLHATGRRHEISACRTCNMYQPSRAVALASSVLDTNHLNRAVPAVETAMSWLRYGG